MATTPPSAVITIDGNDETANSNITASGFDWTPATDLQTGLHTVNVFVEDTAGNGAAAEGRIKASPLARKIAAEGFRVLLHDRRNTGASDMLLDDKEVEEIVWADELRELLSVSRCQYCDGDLVRGTFKGDEAILCDDCDTPAVRVW